MLYKSKAECLRKLTGIAKLYDIDFEHYYQLSGTCEEGLIVGYKINPPVSHLDIRADAAINKDSGVVTLKFRGAILVGKEELTPEELLKAAQQIRNGARLIQKLNAMGVSYLEI